MHWEKCYKKDFGAEPIWHSEFALILSVVHSVSFALVAIARVFVLILEPSVVYVLAQRFCVRETDVSWGFFSAGVLGLGHFYILSLAQFRVFWVGSFTARLGF